MMLPCVAPKQAVAQANCLRILWQTSVRLYPLPFSLPYPLQVESQYCACSCKILNVFAVLCFATGATAAAATICMQFVENRK